MSEFLFFDGIPSSCVAISFQCGGPVEKEDTKVRRAGTFHAQYVANTLWAYATMEFRG
jgi:hypothetical protein